MGNKKKRKEKKKRKKRDKISQTIEKFNSYLKFWATYYIFSCDHNYLMDYLKILQFNKK